MRFALAVCNLLAAVAFAVAPAWAQPTEPARIRLIAFNDFHGHLLPGDLTIAAPHPSIAGRTLTVRSGGAAFLAARIAELRREQPASVVISSGDLVGASPLVSALFRDEPTIEAMNQIGLDLHVVGNHEFDQGVTELRRLAAGGCATTPRGDLATCAHPTGRYEGANFPFLAANVVDREGRTLFAPYVVRAIEGVQIGFIGAVTRTTPGIVMPRGIAGWRFRAEAGALNRDAAELRARGVQAIVAVVHEGGETDGGINDCVNPRGEIFDIVRKLDRAIDVVLSAHTHRAYNCTIDGRIVIQGASFGRLLSVVDLEIDRASGDVVRSTSRNLPVPNDRNDDPDVVAAFPPLHPSPQVAALVAHYAERAAPLAQRPIGRIAGRFTRRDADGGDHAAGRLIADAHLAATRIHGAQIAFTNPGGIRTDLVPREPDGTVTYGDLFAMQPFGNTLVTMTLTGAQIEAILEAQWRRDGERVLFLQPSEGFTYAWRADGERGARIVKGSLMLDGRPIRPDDRFRVTVNSFLAAGGDGFRLFREGRARVGGPLDIDALADFVRSRSADAPLAPDPQPRIRRQR
ncbi:MAG: bifunctional metallophosphatase/5'-nucleotidase [Burkholderiaceae bacterium]|nr:bifunctional metallophosphatase/5'-nucleotidase [Burkholderiaceae bacterium]